jgi:TldD protein
MSIIDPSSESRDDQARTLVQRAVDYAVTRGADDVVARIEEIRTQYVGLRDGSLQTSIDDTDVGFGVRVLFNGALGFAATVDLTLESLLACVDQAVASAVAVRSAQSVPVILANEPGYGDVRWTSTFSIDPTTVPLADKVALLRRWSETVLSTDGISHALASVHAVSEVKYLASNTGTVATQRRVRLQAVVEAVATTADGSDVETMSTVAPPVGRGWEYLLGDGWDWESEVAALAGLAIEKLSAPSIEAGRYDLVIDPTNLWLTIHESIGHATELDRAMGFEAAYAGTSFATPDKLDTLEYGSPIMNVTGDRTVEHGLASIAIDDEGVATERFDLIRDGILVGYQLDRPIAGMVGLPRSNGCAFADSSQHTAMQRMANVSLQPAPEAGPSTAELIARVDRGIYVVGDKSWSIDMQRYNFQFTGQRFYLIENGRIVGQVRDVAYQATTTDFWRSLEAVGGTATYLLGGAFNCGKGQPGQVAPVSHGCPSVLVRNIAILNTRQEGAQ